MNCFEARKEFIAFWRRTMPAAERAAFLAHLGGCARCDRFFRVFALSAPVIYADSTAHGSSQEASPAYDFTASPQSSGVVAERGALAAWSWSALGAVFALAAAAMLALYVAAGPRHQTLEEVMADDSSPVELASYVAAGSGAAQDPFADDSSAVSQDDFAR